MPPADALLPEGATALEIPSDRPAFVEVFKASDVPAAATATRRLVAVSLPDTIKTYINYGSPGDSGVLLSRRIAFACIAPETAPCRAEPGPFFRLVFRTLALDLPQTFKLLDPVLGCGDVPVLFHRPKDREAAMRRQPFVLDGATVRLVPVQMILNVGRTRTENGCMVHVALRDYPVEQRDEVDVEYNCCRVGFVCEIDPACFAVEGPDLSTVRVVLQVQHARQIPHELRINYHDGSNSFVPVEIVRVWDRSHSYNAQGQYVPLFENPDAQLLLGLWLDAMASVQGSRSSIRKQEKGSRSKFRN